MATKEDMSFVYTIKPGVIITLKLLPESMKEKIDDYRCKTDYAEVVAITDTIANKQIDNYIDDGYYIEIKYKVGDTVFDADEMDGGNYFIPNIVYYKDYETALKSHKKIILMDLLY